MAKRCPPGVICIENMTIMFLLSIIGLVILYYFYIQQGKLPRQNSSNPDSHIIINREIINPPPRRNMFGPRNVLLNPYTPPLKNSGYFDPPPNLSTFSRGVPINIKTRGYDTNYSQSGILTRINGPETILPLMGRSLHSSRSKWQYYTMSDKNNSVKLPLSRNGRSCTNEYGCDELFNGDSVYIEGYNDAFKVTIYENNQPRYIPYV
tara:strand:- start:460 stop:1080 length:621 start_codon:yes stop_codon:yes gene_type:complete